MLYIGKSLNYIVSLMISSSLNLEVCVKIFLRMIRCYRESYYILEHANDNTRLLKSVNSTQIAKDAKTVEEHGEYGSTNWLRKIKVPKVLMTYFFDSDVMNTGIAQLVEFIVEKDGETDIDQMKNGKLCLLWIFRKTITSNIFTFIF